MSQELCPYYLDKKCQCYKAIKPCEYYDCPIKASDKLNKEIKRKKK